MNLKTIGLLAGAFCALVTSAAHGQAINVDFFGGGGGGTGGTSAALPATEAAGAVPFANWNSFTNATQATAQTLMNDTGAPTGATVTWASNNTWNTPIAAGTGNQRMMKGYLDSSDTSVTTVNVANLPASITSVPYSVILYYDGDNGGNNRVGRYSISGATTGNAVYWARDAANTNYSGFFMPAQSTVDPLAGGGAIDNNAAAALTVPAGNMMIFSGLSGNSFTLSAQSSVASDATNRSSIQGFQILPTSLVPEPASASVLVLAASLLLGRRRQARA